MHLQATLAMNWRLRYPSIHLVAMHAHFSLHGRGILDHLGNGLMEETETLSPPGLGVKEEKQSIGKGG